MEHDWNLTSHLIAATYNAHRTSKKVPFLKASDINPMAPKRETDLVADITVLRDIFVPGARVRT